MKSTKSYFIVIGLGVLALLAVNIITLYGHFKSLDGNNGTLPSNSRLEILVGNLHQNLKNANSVEAVKANIKSFETAVGIGSGSEAAEKLQKAYAPVFAIYGSKPKEAEDKYLLGRKQALMEGLVNAYRKEVPNGPVPVRAAYLNLLFDTQNSLSNDSDEMEQVYIKKSQDNFANLKTLAASSSDSGLPVRVNHLEEIFENYEKGFRSQIKWNADQSDLLGKLEKSSAKILREIKSSDSDGTEEARRSFLYNSILVLVVSVVVGIALYLTQKLFRLRFESRAESFLSYLRDFGEERDPQKLEKTLSILKNDPDWSHVFEGARETERVFISKFQTLISIPKSLQTPYLVFSKDREVVHWNEKAGHLFGLRSELGVQQKIENIINLEMVSVKEGEPQALVEMIKNSFLAPKEDIFEILLKDGSSWCPMELISSPILTGPLAGGKIYILREIRNEVARIEKAVSAEIERLRDFIHKITHHYPVELKPQENDLVPVREAILDLGEMKLKNEEREALWKSEIQALLDQAERQKQILHKLQKEILEMKDRNMDIRSLVDSIHSTDGNLHEEICLMEKDLNRWISSRERLIQDLSTHNSVMSRIKSFEAELRHATNGVQEMLKSFDEEAKQLNEFKNNASINAVNFSFSKDPAHQEYAAHARAFAKELGGYTDKIKTIVQSVKTFLAKHPGGSLFPMLENTDIDASLLDALKEEQTRLSGFVQRWKEEGLELVGESEKAIHIIKNLEEKSLAATHLGEKSLLINEQTNKNLQRWN